MTGLYPQCSVHPVSQTLQPLCSYVNVYSRVWSAHQDITVGCVTGARKTTTEEATDLKHCLQVYSSTICYVLQTTSLHDLCWAPYMLDWFQSITYFIQLQASCFLSTYCSCSHKSKVNVTSKVNLYVILVTNRNSHPYHNPVIWANKS